MPYQIPEWDEFQQYRDRRPTWIKFHRTLLDNRKFQNLPLAARALLPMLWLLASENKDYMSGIIAMCNDDICFRLRITETELVKSLDVLLRQGFLTLVHSDTELYENVPREETEKRREETEADARTTMPFGDLPSPWREWVHNEYQIDDRIVTDQWLAFREYWTKGKGKKEKRDDWMLTWRNWIRRNNWKIKSGIAVTNNQEALVKAKKMIEAGSTDPQLLEFVRSEEAKHVHG